MKSYSETVQRLKDYADVTSLVDAASRMVFELDAAQRTANRDAEAVHLARNVLLLAACRKAARNVKAEADDPRARFALAELDRLQAFVDQQIKKLLQAGGGIGIGQVGLKRWAEEAVRQADAARKPTASRTSAVSKPKPRATTSRTTPQGTRPRRKTASRAGRCSQCRKDVAYLTTSGVCEACLDKLYPRIARRR